MSVNVTALTTGVPVAAETVGTTQFQIVKLADGGAGSSTPIAATSDVPAGASVGLIVAVKPGVSVSAQVSGTVTVAGGASVVAQVSGTVTAVTSALASTTQAAATGALVWLAPTQTVAVVSTIATVLGTQVVTIAQTSVSVAAVPTVNTIIAVSGITAVSVVSTLVTLLGTVNVAIVAGAGGGGSVTTAVPNITATGQVMWLAGGQSTTAFPLFISNVVQTAVVTLATGGTIATLLGTVAVNVVAGGAGTVNVSAVTPVTTQASVSVTGLPVWFSPGALMALSGTGLVSVVPGVSVIAQASGTITAIVSGIVPATTQASVSVSGLPVWFSPGALVAISGTGLVSVVPGVSVIAQASGTLTVNMSGIVPVTTAASVSVSGVPVWLNPTQQIVVSGLVGHSVTGSVNIVSTAIVSIATGGTIATLLGTQLVSVAASAILGTVVAVSGVTAVSAVSTIVTILGTQVVTLATGGSVACLDVGRTQVMIIVTSTSVGISGTMMLFTVYTGLTQGVAGTSLYVVPNGKTFRVLSAAIVVQNSVTSSPVIHRLFVVASTAAPTWVSTCPVVAAVGLQAFSATVPYSAVGVGIADIAAGATMGIAHTIGTSGGSIVQAVVAGYLFP